MEGEALSTLIVNRLRGTLNVVCVKAPALVTAARKCCRILPSSPAARSSASELGLTLKDATVDMLGRARQVKVTKENTIIVDGAGDKQAIADRVAQIRSQIEHDHQRLRQGEAPGAPGQDGRWRWPLSRWVLLPRQR